jgi:hypothetical protein
VQHFGSRSLRGRHKARSHGSEAVLETIEMQLEQTVKEQLLTMKAAADALGLPYFKIQRAAGKGLIPTYSLLNSRKYVKLQDILSRMATTN